MEARRSRWQQIKIHPVRIVLIALLAVVMVLIILSILGYIFDWDWTGLGPYTSPPHTSNSNFQRGKTLWDWMQLLIIPAVLAVAGYVINLTISRSEQEATKQRAQSEREATEKRAETEREIALDNQREAALQEYIDKMSELLLHEKLCESQPESEVRTIARVRTLTVLPRLDGKRKGSVLQFLHKSNLTVKDKSFIDLDNADLIEANLEFANYIYADLKGVNFREANVRYAQLVEADLSSASLGYVDLSFAFLLGIILNKAVMRGTKLRGAAMQGAKLIEAVLIEADLSHAILLDTDFSNAHLENADLSNAELERADLSGAYLQFAKITPEQLKQAKSLKGTTMTDGSIHP
jgi:uncharacterized protein YjbI with pentapeptide repeats